MQHIGITERAIGGGDQAMRQLKAGLPVRSAPPNQMHFQILRGGPGTFGKTLAGSHIQRSVIRSEIHAPYYLPSWYFWQADNVPSWVCTKQGYNAEVPRMDINSVRLANLQRLIDERFDGRKATLAAAIGKQPDYVSRWFSKRAKHRRNISAASARAIERAAGKPPGWMDTATRQNSEVREMEAPYGRIDVSLLERVIRLVEETEQELGNRKSPAAKAAIIAQGYEKQAAEAHQTDRDKIRRIFLSVTD